MSQIAVIITAGGLGTRMGNQKPKQFLELEDVPIVVLTLNRFLSVLPDATYYLTLPSLAFEEWQLIRKQFLPNLEIKLIPGGKTRFNSVHNALKIVEEDFVCIHDAVRPFINGPTILVACEEAKKYGAAIVTVDLKDSIRQKTKDKSRSVDRTSFCLVQTPQVFNTAILKKAYGKAEKFAHNFTDDASVWEKYEGDIKLIPGSHENIKITLPEDIEIGKAILNFQKRSSTNLA